MKSDEELAEQLHTWYLEATKKIQPNSYNKNAQKKYSDLTEEQKFIDRYIAKKVVKLCKIVKELTKQEATEEILKKWFKFRDNFEKSRTLIPETYKLLDDFERELKQKVNKKW